MTHSNKYHTKLIHQFTPQKEIHHSETSHDMWRYLYSTQIENLRDLAYYKILAHLEELSLPTDRIPQLEEVSCKLYQKTGWEIFKVTELIDNKSFFELLYNKTFPSTIYIRNTQEACLSKDPDIFHEIFGHCPFLLDKKFAAIFQKFGYLGRQFDKIQRSFLQRLFWFTFETGLVVTKKKNKIYGGSLLSSIRESRYAVESSLPIRKPFDMVDVFRTPYRADLIQPIYFVISDFAALTDMLNDADYIKKNIEIAYNLGEHPALFPVEKEYRKYTSYNICGFIKTQSREF